jgi:hypothetical protein
MAFPFGSCSTPLGEQIALTQLKYLPKVDISIVLVNNA